MELFKLRLTDSVIQERHSRIMDSSRAIFYSLFSKFDHQLYLSELKISKCHH